MVIQMCGEIGELDMTGCWLVVSCRSLYRVLVNVLVNVLVSVLFSVSHAPPADDAC